MSKYLLVNGNNYFLGIGSSEANLKSLHTNLDIWHKPQGLVHTISDDDFNALNLNTKTFVSITDGAPVLENNTFVNCNQDDLIFVRQEINNTIDRALAIGDFSNNSAFETAINNYKTALNNWDLSTVTYPVQTSIEKAFEDAGLGTAIGINQLS